MQTIPTIKGMFADSHPMPKGKVRLVVHGRANLHTSAKSVAPGGVICSLTSSTKQTYKHLGNRGLGREANLCDVEHSKKLLSFHQTLNFQFEIDQSKLN